MIVAVLTSNLRLAEAPGNILVTTNETGLPQDSVVNVSQVITVDKSFLTEPISQVSDRVMLRVDDGLRLVLAL
ncbi:MAG: type II toxin-antitoxin system PemK/MazF family toxin [Coleofasciculus sp.]|uniref:type II toxin-antitoxin system PemK/MazF family toxin n=1 Tax=Coleofasciculus sp. TaxID=3100458 RepID=UPI003A328048